MPTKHPEDLKLLAVVMARMMGPEQAAEDLKLDVRTVKAWTAQTPPEAEMDEPMAGVYASLERAAAYRMSRALARGEVRDPLRLNAIYGTARDKLFRFATGRAARQAATAAEPEPDPVRAAMALVPDGHGRWLREYIDDRDELDEVEARNGGTVEPSGDASSEPFDEAAFWRDFATWPQERLDAGQAELAARAADLLTGWTASRVHGGHAIYDRNGVEFTRIGAMSAIWQNVPVLVDADVGLDVTPQPINRLPDTSEHPSEPPVAVPATTGSAPMVTATGGREGNRDGPWFDIDSGERRRPNDAATRDFPVR